MGDLSLGLLLVGGGFVVALGVFLWARQRQALGFIPTDEAPGRFDLAVAAASDDAVLVAREHGQLIFINERARRWLGVNGGHPDLEYIATLAQPADSFLDLFAREGQASFQLGTRWVAASSHSIPDGTQRRMVVVLRELAAAASRPGALDLSLAMATINEIGETVNASMSVEQVLQTLLAIVMKAVPAASGQICLWDKTTRTLEPRGWAGDALYLVALAEQGGVYKLGEGLTGWIAKHRRPALVGDVSDVTAIQPKLAGFYSSYVGVPLSLGERFVGTFELAHQQAGFFGQTHLALLQALSKPMTTAIINAELYQAQARRIRDMSSLQEVPSTPEALTDTRPIYQALNARIARLIAADVCGLLIYDENRRALAAELPVHGLPDYAIQNYTLPLTPGSPAEEIWRHQPYWLTNDAADEPLVEPLGLKPLVSVAGLRSIVFMPLAIGSQRLGMLLVCNKQSEGGFSPQDLLELRLLAGQAAVVVENARLYQREQRRSVELTGLQEITHAIGAISQEREFYSTLTERIARLMDIQMCGILLYDEASSRLVSQPPFYGISNELIQHYVVDVPPGSPIYALWQEEDYWYSNRVQSDAVVYEAGLAEFAEAVGVTKTMFAVMTVGGRRIGVVQASNKNNGEDFSDKDAQFLLIFAAQAAAIIENGRLYQDVQRRALEAERLRQIAEMSGAILTIQDDFKPVLRGVAELMDSPGVFISILDEQTGHLTTLPNLVYGIELDEALVQDMYAVGFMQRSPAASQRAFMSNDVLAERRILESYRQIAQRFNLRRVVLVPVTVGERSLGEIGVANRDSRPYDADDVRRLTAIATQVAAMIERIRLYQAAAFNLERREQELEAISRVSDELKTTLELDPVLETLLQEAARAVRADGATIALLRPVERWADPTRPEMERRLGGDGALADIEIEAVNQGADYVLLADYETADKRPFPPPARSAIAAAFLYEDRIVGVIHLYHSRPNHFDDRAGAFLLTMAANASLGFGNNKRYLEQLERSVRAQRRAEQLNQIFELGRILQSSADPVTVLEEILDSIQQSVGFETGVASLLDDDQVLRRVAQAGMPLDVFEASRRHILPLEQLRAVMRDEYRVSESYFFPVEARKDWLTGDMAALGTGFEGARRLPPPTDDKSWQDGDLLLVPLLGSGGNLLGVMSFDRPQDDRRPERSTIEILEIFAHQAASTIENTRLYLESLKNAEQEARLNEMMEAVARTLDVNQIVEAAAYGALRMVPFTQMTVALVDEDRHGFDVLRVHIHSDSTLAVTHERRSHIERTALLRAFEDGSDQLYLADSPEIARYDDLRAWHERGERTSLIVPLIAGGQPLGALHLGSDLENAYGFSEFRPLLKRMANLSAVAIQNARLFNRALNLQSFNESVVESIQQGIIVVDKSGLVVSVNETMRQRYGWQAERAIGRDLFAYSPKLLRLADPLKTLLQTGQPQELIWQQSGDSDHLVVNNFYLYPLRGADEVTGAVILIEDVTERALLERDIEARANQLAVLTEVSSRITSSLNRDEVISLALEEMGRIISYDTMTLWSRSGDVLQREGSAGYDEEVAIADDSLTQIGIHRHERLRIVVETQRPYTISQLQGWDPLPGEDNAQSWMGVPLVNQGYVVGLIALAKAQPSFYTAQLQQAALAFANQVAIALANADLFAESQRRTERLQLLNRVSLALAQSLDSENILEIALREIAGLMGVPLARALLFERDLNIGRVIVTYPRGDAPPDEFVSLMRSPTYQQMRRTVQPVIIEDVYRLLPGDLIRKELEPKGTQALVLIPMTVGGQVIGAFELEVRAGPRFFTPEQIDLAAIIASQAAIAVQNTNLLEQQLIRTRELETLLEAAQATSLTLNLDEVFRTVVELMLHALDMDACGVMLWDNVENALEVQLYVERSGDPQRALPRGTTFNLRDYPARLKALSDREVVVLRSDQPETDAAELESLRRTGAQLRVLVPLVVRDQAIGLVLVETVVAHKPFSHREIRLALALGAQAAIAIQNARLSTETADLVEEGFIINNLSQAISSKLKINDMIAIVRDQIPRVTDAEELYLALYDSETQQISFPMAVRRDGTDFTIPPRQLNTDEVSFIIRHRRSLPLGGGNWSSDDMRRNLSISNGEGDYACYLGVPIVAGDEVLGVLAVRDSKNARAFGINDERLLTTVGTQLGAAIQNARLFERVSNFANELNERVKERTLELQKERDRLDTLYRITSDLATSLDMDRVLKRALELVVGAVAADDGVIILQNPLTDRLYTRASLNQPNLNGASVNGDAAPHPAEGLARWLIQNGGSSVVVDDLHGQPYWNADDAEAHRWRSAVAVLLENNDDIHGVMVILSQQTGMFTDVQVRLIIAAANQVASAIYNAELYHLIRDQAERLGMLVRSEREETEKSNAILESIADGVMLADAEGTIVMFNSAAERILDLPRDSVIGQTVFKLSGLFGESAVSWTRAIQEWAADPQRYRPGDFFAEQLDLGRRVVSVHLSPVNMGDDFLGTVSVFRDITKEVEVDRIKSEFVSNVSHELRTPMTSIKGFADLLLLGVAGQVSDPQRNFLLKIKNNADRLSQLVDDLLNISRIDAGEKLNLELVDVSKVVQAVVSTVPRRSEHAEKDIHLLTNIAPDLPPIRADEHKLTQILSNLLDNAFNYTLSGGTIEVSAHVQPDGEHVLVAVKDTGIGIPEEFRSRIWQRFERFDEHALVMDVAGTGLGLSIVKELVQMHNGEVWFESQLGKGTTFFVSLPVEQPELMVSSD